MPGPHDLYQRLRAIRDTSVDRAMAAALPTADPRAKRLIALSLLERKHAGSGVALVLNYHQLDEDTQHAVVRQVEDLYRPMREAVGSTDQQAWSNVIEIVRLSRSARLAYLVTEQLRHSATEVRQAAAQCLQELAAWASTERRKPPPERPGRSHAAGRAPTAVPAAADGNGAYCGGAASGARVAAERQPADARTTAFLETAVSNAVESFPVHQQVAVLLALSHLAPRPMPELRRRLASAAHPALAALRPLLEASPEWSVRRALLWFARIPSLTEAALTGVHTAARRGQLGDVLGNAHLTIDARVRRLLAKLGNPEQLIPAADQLGAGVASSAAWAPHEWRGLPHWIAALPLTAAQKVQKLAALGRATDAPTRLAALRQLMALSAQTEALGACSVIAEFCRDPDPQLARIALRHLLRRQWDGLAALLLKLINAAHPDLRALAAEELAPLGFERLWSAWPRLSGAKRLAAGRALIKLDPGFHRLLAARLSQNDHDTAMRAVSMICCLHQGQFFEQALETLIQGPDKRLASAAVKALGTSGSSSAVGTLKDALVHADSRVRANAVEALHASNSTEHLPQLVQMARQDASRPRANAIGVLLERNVDEGLQLLLRMLADERPAQRASALWLIDHLELVQVARQVAETSISDADADVRRRARRVIQHLIAALSPAGEPTAEAVPTTELKQ